MDSNMRNTRNGLRIVLTLLVIVLILLAMGSHALPMAADGVSIVSGLEFLKKADALVFPELAIPVALVVTVSALVFALTAFIRKKALIGECICSLTAMVLMAVGTGCKVLTVGFAAFQSLHLAVLCLSIAALNVKSRKKEKEVAVPVDDSLVVENCSVCGKPLDEGSTFCGFCGTPVAVPQAEEPKPAPAQPVCARCGTALSPNDKFCLACGNPIGEPAAPAIASVAKNSCARCGAEMGDGEAFCGFCGAPATAAQPVVAPVPVEHQNPEPAPAPEQPQTCAVCGKTLIPGAKFCLGCGTPVGVIADARSTCARCGAELGDGDAFCGFCGAPASK